MFVKSNVMQVSMSAREYRVKLMGAILGGFSTGVALSLSILYILSTIV